MTFHRLARLRRACDGMAAAEFGLILPVFVLALLGMIDVGTAIYERMKLDQALRAGAQLVISGIDDQTLVQNAVIGSGDMSTGGTLPEINAVPYSVTLNKSCECAGAAGSCSVLCTSGEPPSVFYDLAASQTMQTILLPTFDVSSFLRIQLR